jgi:hypothetical protein
MIKNQDIITAFTNTKAFRKCFHYDISEHAIIQNGENKPLIRIIDDEIYFQVSYGQELSGQSLYLGDFDEQNLKKLANSFFIKKSKDQISTVVNLCLSIKQYYKFRKIEQYQYLSLNFNKTQYLSNNAIFTTYSKDGFGVFTTIAYKKRRVFILHCQFSYYLYDFNVFSSKKLLTYLTETEFEKLDNKNVEFIINQPNFIYFSSLCYREELIISEIDKYFKIKNDVEIVKELKDMKKNIEKLIVKVKNNIN